ncbi:TolB family protein [Ferruginibacter yonginensis]|uniref:TolB family protein n=1 Tax=Ferruginibacter yonginensis TaxID=1310416 RepID=A0ABV8QP16_9BACT
MKYLLSSVVVAVLVLLMAFKTNKNNLDTKSVFADSIHFAGEVHFKNVRQLTFGGDNAEAYFSKDGKYLVFQKTDTKTGIMCDQIWLGKVPQTDNEKFEPKLVSTGTGRTTCAYFYPDNKHILYASTHLADAACPPVPDRKKYGNKYIWPIYQSMDIFKADLNGKIVKQLTKTNGYDAEATISPKGDKMVFTSMRDGDLELYTMDLNGKNVKRITNMLGYDGGAWFSPDGTKILWRASRPTTPEEVKEYKELLAENLVAPTHMEVWIANADGSDAHAITNLAQANWAPNFTPDGKHVIFCSNHEYKYGFPFNMYMIDLDGKNMQKISRDKGFDAFPMFTTDGKKIVFSSNRNNGGTRDTNIFIADWVN